MFGSWFAAGVAGVAAVLLAVGTGSDIFVVLLCQYASLVCQYVSLVCQCVSLVLHQDWLYRIVTTLELIGQVHSIEVFSTNAFAVRTL